MPDHWSPTQATLLQAAVQGVEVNRPFKHEEVGVSCAEDVMAMGSAELRVKGMDDLTCLIAQAGKYLALTPCGVCHMALSSSAAFLELRAVSLSVSSI
jgi:cytidine deaminase